MKLGRIIALAFFLFLAFTAGAQLPNGANEISDTSATPKGIEFHVDIPDSVLKASIFMFQLQPLQVKIFDYDHPVFDPSGVQFNNPLDGFNGNYYLYTTELGHPHIEIFHDYTIGLGLGYRPCLFPGFYKTPANITLYQVQKPYTLLAYHSSLKKDYQLHVTHTQNITERWNVALDYHLFSPQGTYANSTATNHLIDFSTNYYSRDSRYMLTAGIISQKMNIGENEGLQADSIYTLQMVEEEGVPVNESMRHSLTHDLTLYTHQSYNMVRQFEWLRPIHQQVIDTIPDTTSGKRDSVYFRVHDTIVGFDTIQPHTPHVFNVGLIAMDVQYDKQQYRYIDSTRYRHLTARLYWTNDAYLDAKWRNPFKLTLGIRPEIERLELRDDLNPDVINTQYYPFVQTNISLGEVTDIRILGEMGIGSGEYNLSIDPTFTFGKSDKCRTLSLQAQTGAASPAMIYSLQSSDAGNLRNVETLRLSSKFQGRWINLLVAANRIGHNIWLDKNLRTIQSDSSALLLQGCLSANLSFFGHLHYDMQQLVQYSSDQDQIRVPFFASKNSLYVDFNLFHGALRTQIGGNLRYHTAFKADGYAPSLGVFYRQDEIEVGNYLYGDVFLNFQVKRASIYVKAGHLNSLFEQRNFCILPHYPMRGFGVFYGLTWQFFD